MRRVILAVLLAVLAGLMAVRLRSERPGEAVAAMTVRWDETAYNVLALEAPSTAGTAGSTLAGRLDQYYFSRTPTAKSAWTGLLAGRDLILLLAADWLPGVGEGQMPPVLERLRSEGVRFQDVYAPDWYQGADGPQFALLSGLTPTAAGDRTALTWVGEQGVSLPFSLGSALGAAGYTCRLWPAEAGREESYRALGFEAAPPPASDRAGVDALLEELDQPGLKALCLMLTGRDPEGELERLLETLEEKGRTGDTVLCLWTGGGGLWLWAEGLAGVEAAGPCSELDVTPTLLDLLGAAYDGRFLSGRDLLAGGTEDAPVSLAGSAYADWVTAAGRYSAAEERFYPADGRTSGQRETDLYVRQMRRQVYEQYVCARTALESNYFRTVVGR